MIRLEQRPNSINSKFRTEALSFIDEMPPTAYLFAEYGIASSAALKEGTLRSSRSIAILVTTLLLSILISHSSAQQVPPSPPVIRINVNLVQVDAVVTDSRGNPVTNLKADDFEVFQDGKPQVITNFEFVDVKTAAARGVPARGVAPRRGNAPAAPPPPPTRGLRPQQIRRTIAMVVDDLGLSFDSISRIQSSLKKWVENEMQPGDLVAVIRTSAGMGSLQQFTNDKRALLAAINLVRYHVGRVGVSSFAPLTPAGPIDTTAFDQELSRHYSIGSMGAITWVVQGLREVPGRKSLILFSESMALGSQNGRDQEAEERMRKLSDAANRSSVVIYGVDPRGVVYTGLTAEDSGAGRSPQQLARVFSDRSNDLLYSREAMQTLAEKTGGLFVADNNDISDTLRQAVDDGNGYYLLAYQPATTTFVPGEAKFHSISVRLKRPDLRVRSRTGFYGTPDRGTPPPRTPIEQITRALTSPFASGNVRVRLTTLFSQSEKQGPYVNALLHIDANDLTFNQDADGFRTTTVDIAAVTFNADGQQIEGASKTWRFRLPSKTHEEVLRTGLVYSLHVPVKKAGAYQMRLAVRDNASQLLGSASQFIEVPDVKKGRLTLSGLVLGGDRVRTAEGGEPAEGPILEEDANSTPAVRIFKQGMAVVYGYGILNARTDRNKKTQLEVQTRLFRDGQEVFASSPSPLNSDGQPNPQRLVAGGRLQLTQLAPGDYALQVIVTDKLASEKNRVAAQSMDFEVR
ncbi:MAG TPA: VWA domain-containing protein [Terriglobia bacterium]|nr:VWA domain-containing protein [Terriglobia bacterium]